VEEAGEAVEAATRAKLRIGRAECLLEMGRSTEAMADAKHARKEAERASSEALSARALLALGRAQSDQGRSASARRLVKDALGRFESLGDIRGQGWAHHRLSETFSRTDMAREIQHLKQAHALFTRSRDSWGRAIVAQDLAYMLTTRGDAEFERWFAEARRLADVEGDLRSRAEVLRTLGYVRFYRGDNVGAIEAMREARPIAVEAGERYAEADTLIIEAMAAAVVDGPSAAVALSNEVLRVGRELRSARITMLGSLALARAVLRSGSPERAGKALATAARIQRDQGIAVESPEVGRIRAQIMIDRGSWAGVRGVSNEVGQAIGASDLLPLWRPLPKLLTGQAMLGAGRHEAAYEELVEAVDLARKGGAKGTLAMASALRDQSSLFHPGMADPVPLSSPEPEVRATLAENEGISAARAGDAARALERFADAVALRTRVGKSSFLVRALGMQAEALRRLGDRRGATRLVRRAGSLLSALETPERSKPALLHPLAGLDN
jgi:tetratricopeptide (TPR) repeat protein